MEGGKVRVWQRPGRGDGTGRDWGWVRVIDFGSEHSGRLRDLLRVTSSFFNLLQEKQQQMKRP